MSEMFWKLWENGLILRGIWETVYMTLLSAFFSYLIGLPLGLLLSVTDKDGIRPIEEIDTLAVENRLKNSFPEMLDDWFAVTALGGSSFDSDERMTKLVDIYQQVTQNTFVMKGFATKVTFGAEFLECIYDAISKTDMAISVDFEGDQGFSRGRRGSGRRYGIRNDMARNDRGTHDNRSRGDRYVQTGYRRGSRR